MNTGPTTLYFSTGTLDVVFTPNPVPIPEPAGCLLLGTGLLAMALKKRGLFFYRYLRCNPLLPHE